MFWLCQRSRLGSSAHVTVDQLTEEKKDKILSQIQTTKAGTVTADLYPSIPVFFTLISSSLARLSRY